jgi:hypothetical protein
LINLVLCSSHRFFFVLWQRANDNRVGQSELALKCSLHPNRILEAGRRGNCLRRIAGFALGASIRSKSSREIRIDVVVRSVRARFTRSFSSIAPVDVGTRPRNHMTERIRQSALGDQHISIKLLHR